ncbi:nodulation protein NodN [Amylibacter ulvae]|uniref:Nodulation protein NodN n=1 Tax=Paramylibacter ulvae TaxID=1651968 RepID=A0ABQ3CYK8_9RHOB|nr:MaoC family dehydratase [Amylibacter ulvae]GHA42786.1 nodulation protein NodN [Amylibacter ulvae]
MSPQQLDLEAYQTLIGKPLGVSDWFQMDQSRINAFADVTLDHQFIHLDDARAKSETPFGGTIAHGYLTLALLTHMINQVAPVPKDAQAQINYGLNRVRFLHPVTANARIRANVGLDSIIERRKGQYLFEFDVTMQIENVKTPALMAKSLALYTF